MTVMIVTFFNASGIDFGNFLNAHLRSTILSPNYVAYSDYGHAKGQVICDGQGTEANMSCGEIVD
jgi:hypothetical protein